MKYIALIAILIVVSFVAWPYVNLYRLDNALINNDQTALRNRADLDALRDHQKSVLDQEVDKNMAQQDDFLSSIIRDGTSMLGGAAIDKLIDEPWVRDQLRVKSGEPYPSIMAHLGYAFFESPTRFVTELQHNTTKIEFRMELQDWSWRVTEINR